MVYQAWVLTDPSTDGDCSNLLKKPVIVVFQCCCSCGLYGIADVFLIFLTLKVFDFHPTFFQLNKKKVKTSCRHKSQVYLYRTKCILFLRCLYSLCNNLWPQNNKKLADYKMTEFKHYDWQHQAIQTQACDLVLGVRGVGGGCLCVGRATVKGEFASGSCPVLHVGPFTWQQASDKTAQPIKSVFDQNHSTDHMVSIMTWQPCVHSVCMCVYVCVSTDWNHPWLLDRRDQ